MLITLVSAKAGPQQGPIILDPKLRPGAKNRWDGLTYVAMSYFRITMP